MAKTLMCLLTSVIAVMDGDGGVLMQTQDTSASLSLGAASLLADSQFTQVEESLHATLLDVVKDAESIKKLPAGWLNGVKSMMEGLRNQTEADHARNQRLIDLHAKAVSDCNSNLKTEFVTVDKLKGKVSTWRTTHADCRNTHVGLVDDAQSACNAFEQSSTLSCDKKPSCACSTSGCATGKANVACQADLAAWLAKYQQDLVNADSTCDTKVGDAASKHNVCNQAQTDFEAYHCELSVKLLDTCQSHSGCYRLSAEQYGALEKDVKVHEDSLKHMWIAERKISCYLGLFEKAEAGGILSSSDITDCINKKFNTDHLNIQYPTLPAQDACDDALAYWQPTEYDALNATFLQPTTQCALDSIKAPAASPATGTTCLKVVTNIDSGTMAVTVKKPDGTVLKSLTSRSIYKRNSVVIDECWSVNSIVVDIQGITTDGWAGSFTVSDSKTGTYKPMQCTNCQSGTSTDRIMADADNSGMAPTKCNNLKTCQLIPV